MENENIMQSAANTEDIVANTTKEETNTEKQKLTHEEKKAQRKEKFDVFVRAGKLSYRNIKDESFEGFTKQTNQIITDENRSYLEKYTVRLMNHEFSDNYFDWKDGYIHYYLKQFFKASFGTPDAEIVIHDLRGFINQRFYYITTLPQDADSLKLKMLCKKFRKAYFTNSTIDNIFNGEKENPLKEAAWIATHSFVTGIFLNPERVFRLIPRGNNVLIPIWNQYIDKLDDISEEVKEIFRFDEGTCPYLEHHKEFFCEEKEHEDDIPFSSDADVEGYSIDISSEEEKQVEEKAAQMDQEYKEDIAKDDEADIHLNIDHSTKKNEAAININTTKEAPKQQPVEEPIKEEPIVNTNSTFIFNGFEINIPENNKDWEKVTPRLDKFTRCVNKLGLQVAYGLSSEYPGLIQVYILNNKNEIVNQLMLDPCIIYGDTLRIITRDAEDRDIRKETFIPISQENVVVKAIKNTLTKNDKKAMRDKIPAGFTLDNKKYSLIDRLDLRGIMTDGKNGIPFDQWKEFIGNVSEAITNYPDIRFRVDCYESPKKFNLVCDTNVLASFNTRIFSEPNHIAAVQQNLVIPVSK